MSLEKLDDMDYVSASLARLDSQFDLVILTEYYWEGIVLLKHMLCAEYQHIFKPNVNVKEYQVKPLDEIRQKIFEDFHKADILMYNYFNASMHRKIEAFGKQVFERTFVFW